VRTGGVDPERIYVNRGYRGHDYDGDAQVIIAGQKLGLTPTMRREQKRRNGLEAVIGHAKFDHRMDRNYLLGVVGDAINALAATCGYNLRRILDAIRRLCALVILMFITGTAKFDTWTAPTSNLRSTA
jgi:IS5 family transposase